MKNNSNKNEYNEIERYEKILKIFLVSFYSVLAFIIVFLILWLLYAEASKKLVFVEKNIQIGKSETANLAIINARDVDLKWYSTNKKVANVDDNGNVIAVNTGKTKIIAKTEDSKNWAICNLVVVDDTIFSKIDNNDVTDILEDDIIADVGNENISVDDIVLSTSNLILEVGNLIPINVNVLPYNASNKKIHWTTDNSNVVKINENGIVTALSVGEAVVIAISDDNNIKKECKIKVLDQHSDSIIKVSDIKLSKQDVLIDEGSSVYITANIIPSNASNKVVNWTSSDENVAIVGVDGKIIGLNSGEAVITVESFDRSISKNINVVVLEPKITVTELVLSKTSVKIKENKQTNLSVDVVPSNATNKTVIWKSADSNIATVDQNGVITAKNVGNTKIIATTPDGKISIECIVEVEKSLGYDLIDFDFNLLDNCAGNNNLIIESYNNTNSKVGLFSCVNNLILNSYQSIQNFAYTGDYLYFVNTGMGGWTNQTYLNLRGNINELKRISTNFITRIGNNNPKIQYNSVQYAGHSQSFDVAKINNQDVLFLNYFPSLSNSNGITYRGESAIGPKHNGFTWFEFINNSNKDGALVIPKTAVAIGKPGYSNTIVNSSDYKANNEALYNKIISIACSSVYNQSDKNSVCTTSNQYLSSPEIGIDEANDKIIFISGKKVYSFSLSQIQSGNLILLNSYDITYPTTSARQGVEISDNYLYLWFGATGDNPVIAKYDLNNGNLVSHTTFNLSAHYRNRGKVNFEAEGISIHNGKVYVGVVNRECVNAKCTSTRAYNDIYQVVGI